MKLVQHPRDLIRIIAPGMMVAASGVGAGDLATGAFAGSQLGTEVLWAVIIGAAFKYILTEGLTKWQLATGTTILEGAIRTFGWPVQVFFITYLILWSFFVGTALMAASGLAAGALLPPILDPSTGKMVYGILQSLVCCVLIYKGGFSVFEKLMKACIVLMFMTVIFTASMMSTDLSSIISGLVIRNTSNFSGERLSWVIALIGGVGGTLTILCYGYWIREKNRMDVRDLKTCRIDLGVSYLLTAIFGMAVVIIGSEVKTEGSGANLLVNLANSIKEHSHPSLAWIFLIGCWSAMFSSLLGVWQSVPYVFSDFCRISFGSPNSPRPDHRSMAYQLYLLGLAVVPALGLFKSFKQIQKYYSVFGAMFLPLLAIVLLLLNRNPKYIGPKHRNSVFENLALLAVIGFFIMTAILK